MTDRQWELHLRERRVVLDAAAPWVMAIVNASPESFYDGAARSMADEQVAFALACIDEGAHILDVGGESGVTNRAPVTPEEEVRRVLPVVEALVARGALVSVDTWKAPVAQAVLAAGAHMINDVSGLRDPEIARLCAQHGAALVVMHTRAEPKRKEFPRYDDVVADVVGFLAEKIDLAQSLGVAPEQLVLDPGPDFAKRPAETVTVLRHLDRVLELGRPVLLAASRKDFVGALTQRRPAARLAGTLAAIGAGVDAGAAILRVHDVAATVDYLTVRAALRDAPLDPDLMLAEHLRREPPGGAAAPEAGA